MLLVDDEPALRLALTKALSRDGHDMTQATENQEAVERLVECKPWLVLADMRTPRKNRLDVVRAIKKQSPGTLVVVMPVRGSVQTVVEAITHGMRDNCLTPLAIKMPEQSLLHSETTGAAKTLTTDRTHEARRPIVTADPAMLRLLSLVEGVAASQATVLIQSESGTGKELLARLIHHRGPRGHRPFVPVNCAALPDGLLQSDLFGHERGAFPGARFRKIGKFELAHNGTLLLDEISEMSPDCKPSS